MMKPCTSILVVDDEPLNYEVIEEFLSTEDYELHYVPNGIDALNSIGKIYAPDLILLDFMMPGLDGVEVCRRLRATPEWKMVPIIMVTALNGKEDLARCLNAGADDFISKPLHRLELVSRIQAMLRLKYQYDEVKKLSHLQQDTIQFLERSLAQIHGNLGSTLSHEMNTPLHGIMTILSLLKRKMEQFGDFPEVLELIEIGLNSAKRLDALQRKFLNYLYLESATRSQTAERPNINSPLNWTAAGEAVEIAQIKAEQYQRSQDLTSSVANNLIGINSKHFHWLLGEVIENAFKFSKAGTVVHLTGSVQADWFRLEIHDRGRGMTADQIDGIGAFIQFERSHYEQQGTGLGLSIAQKVMELYGGKLVFSSVYQAGTTVTLDLPLIPEE